MSAETGPEPRSAEFACCESSEPRSAASDALSASEGHPAASAAPTVPDRVTYNEPGDWLGPDYALGLVDEIVVSDALAHLEMTTDSSGYLSVTSPRRDVFARIRARPTTRRERRQILARNDDRLRDHLRSVIPALHRRNMRTIWCVPWWRRPASALRDWRDAARAAAAVLCVDVEEDRHCGGPEAAP